jgi:hypothetical protein
MHKLVRESAWVVLMAALPFGAQAQSPAAPPAGTTTPPAVTNAQTPVHLSREQKAAILTAIQQKGANVNPSLTFRATPGEMVPPSIELYPLPDTAMTEVPDAKNLKYTMLDNNIVLVDPLTMRVVDTIAK